MSSADGFFDIIFTSERLVDAFYELDVFLEKLAGHHNIRALLPL